MFRPPSGRRPIRIALALASALFLAAATTVALRVNAQQEIDPDTASSSAVRPAESGDQPIAFSHRHHVTEIGIDCQFCHTYARRSPVAGIPSVQTCVGCHRVILNEQPEIQKVLQYWEDEAPIPWVRVHDLPDHVRFTHKRHVRAGLACEVCHGDVSQMEAAVRVESLSMGWCLSCHDNEQAPNDCLICHY